MKKRILSIVLVLALLVSVVSITSLTAYAAEPEESNIELGGIRLNIDSYVLQDDPTHPIQGTPPANTDHYLYVVDENSILLKNFTYEGSGGNPYTLWGCGAISGYNELYIQLIGENSITATEGHGIGASYASGAHVISSVPGQIGSLTVISKSGYAWKQGGSNNKIVGCSVTLVTEGDLDAWSNPLLASCNNVTLGTAHHVVGSYTVKAGNNKNDAGTVETKDIGGIWESKKYIEITAIPDQRCICGDKDCTKTTDGHQQITFNKALTSAGGTLATGNYYLTGDVKLTNNITVVAGTTLNICLNGHVLEGKGGGAVFEVAENGTLNICDCNGANKQHKLKRHPNYSGDKVWQYVGDWDPEAENDSAVMITGGLITGGDGKVFETPAGPMYANRKGGAIYTAGTVNLYGGNIAGNLVSPSASAQKVEGGAVYITETGTFTMYGGNIAYNAAKVDGGVYIESEGIFTMNGGSIVRNYCLFGASAVRVGGVFNMNGGNIQFNETLGGDLGAVLINNDGDVQLSGDVVISDNTIPRGSKLNVGNILLAKGQNIVIIGALGESASIGITTAVVPTAAQPVKVAVGDTGHTDISGDKDKFFADNSKDYAVEYDSTNKQINLGVSALPFTGVSAANVEETYDGNEHGITVNLTGDAVGATVKYGETKGTYDLNASPTYKNAGTKTVYYKVTKEGFKDYTGSATVTINKKAVTVTPKAGQSKIYGNTDPTFEYDTTQMVSGDTLSGKLGRASGNNKGEYAFTLGTLANSNYNITLAANAPKFEIKAKPVTLSWSEKTAFTYNGTNQGITAEVTNKVGSDVVTLTYADNTKTAVGNYTARVTALSNPNYTLEGATNTTKAWSIAYLETSAEASIPANSNEWYTTESVTITAPNGYVFSYDGKTNWKSSDTITAQGTTTKTYYLKNTTTGYITAAKTVSFKLDSASPTADVKIKSNSFKTFMNKITFGLFFKNNVDVTITDNDATSGIKSVQYQMVEKEEDYNENGNWITGNSFSITADNKCIIYVKVTDNAGNVTIVNSNGIVVYTDTTVTADEQTYTRTTKTDVVTGVTIGNNTIDKITLNGNSIATTNYSVNSSGKLVFNGNYLNTLAANDYTFTVSYKPMNETYVSGADNEAPTNTVVTLHVVKKAGTAQITNTLDKVYNGSAVVNPAITKDSTATATVTYTVFGANAYTADKPVNAGKYTVKVVVPADNDYTAVTITKDFTISKADGSVTITNDISKTFDAAGVIGPNVESSSTGERIFEYKTKGADDSTYRDGAPFNAGTYIVRVTVKEDGNYKQASATADFTISKKAVTVTADNLSKVYGEKDPELTYKEDGVIEGVALNDITITRAEGEDAGRYDITVSQKENANPNYDINFISGEFEITRKTFDEKDIVVTLGDALAENGKEQTQEVKSVKVGDEDLTFTVDGNKKADPGTYEMTITLTGNYEGEFKHKFVIVSNKDDELKDIGDVKVEVKGDKNAPKAELENSESEMIQMLLTADELSSVANGDTANVWLEVTDATNSISDEAKKAITNGAKGYELGQFIDISLFKKLDSQEVATQIHETDKKVKITITIPDSLLTTDKYTERTFFIARNHEGEVTVIEGVFDKEAKTFTFETDRFSDYAIVYKDVVNKPADQGGKTSPKTGDTSNLALWILLLCISGAALTVTTLYGRKKRTTK